MLLLSRKPGQSIKIDQGGGITVTVTAAEDEAVVSIGVDSADGLAVKAVDPDDEPPGRRARAPGGQAVHDTDGVLRLRRPGGDPDG